LVGPAKSNRSPPLETNLQQLAAASWRRALGLRGDIP